MTPDVELYLKHRPASLDLLVGQDDVVRVLRKHLKAGTLPHSLLFSGPAGCGKTTVARILKKELKCSDHDFVDLNAADFKGVDVIRDIRRHMGQKPLEGLTRVWLMDEVHKLTSDAQGAFLKILEDGRPRHAYFFLATTDPQKLAATVRQRCEEFRLRPVKAKILYDLLARVVAWEKAKVSKDVLTKIADAADGSPRKALVILGKVIGLSDEAEMLAGVEREESEKAAFALVQAMMPFKGRPRWEDVAKVLQEIAGEEPEGVRQLVLKVARTSILKGGPRAFQANLVIQAFRDPLYDSHNAANAILAGCCWDVVQVQRK